MVEDLDIEDTVIHGLDCHSDVYLGVAGHSSRHCCWAQEGHLDMPYNLLVEVMHSIFWTRFISPPTYLAAAVLSDLRQPIPYCPRSLLISHRKNTSNLTPATELQFQYQEILYASPRRRLGTGCQDLARRRRIRQVQGSIYEHSQYVVRR